MRRLNDPNRAEWHPDENPHHESWTTMKPTEGRKRVVIEEITPQVDAGRYPACRTKGDLVTVSAAVFGDGHDLLAARVLYRHKSERRWRWAPMRALGNDLWTGSFTVDKLGIWQFTVLGWVDHFDTWVRDLKKRLDAQPNAASPNAEPQNIPLALRTGAILLDHTASRARGTHAAQLKEVAASLRWMADQDAAFYDYPLSEGLVELARLYPDLSFASRYEPELTLWVDRERARYSTWYELFPRSASPIPGQHGTFRDVIAQIPEIAAMGFDVLYMPPIHPIGSAFRKGKNNSTQALAGDVGSPWAIGAAPTETSEGGHKAILPELGTFDDFAALHAAAHHAGMELALDIAFQCSPDHPWVKQHPAWFIQRPDGSIQYAENPPKKYQDIYPLNFESAEWRSLWDELKSVFEFWIERGVKIFRVDNPHTKALPFWEWCTNTLRERHPDIIFLAEAFTRPHVMYSLAKAGFTQSYTYFTWRTGKAELQSYLEEIVRPPVSDFFRPNFWPNTPDILHKQLQEGGRPAFVQRLILAATLTANYGIYGPAYELCENAPAKPAPGKTESEEYLDSEKYEIRQRDRNAAESLVPLITSLNNIRRANPALQSNDSLTFHETDNPTLLSYSKLVPDGLEADGTTRYNTILVVVNLDSFNEQAGWTNLNLDALHIPYNKDFIVEDLLTGAQYTWHDRFNYVALHPATHPAHVFRIAHLA
jgi:starch synthase (maltosyl-transferring)